MVNRSKATQADIDRSGAAAHGAAGRQPSAASTAGSRWPLAMLLVSVLGAGGGVTAWWKLMRRANTPPAVNLNVDPMSGPAPLTVLLDAGGTSDADNDQLTFTWLIDDVEIAGSHKKRSSVFEKPGIHRVLLRVSDGDAQRELSAEINVEAPRGVTGPQPTPVFRSTPVRLRGDKASIVKPDADVGSDDWTEVKVSYVLNRSLDNRLLTVTVTMDVKELEKNGAYKDKTHLRTTSDPIKILQLDRKDARQIVGVSVKESGSRTMKFSGEVHGERSFEDVGALGNIVIVVDGSGDDLKRQSLDAQFACEVVLDVR